MGVTATLSGNEITDANRPTEGDGRLSDSSMGIYRARTNIVTTGGFEAGLGIWGSRGTGITVTRVTSDSKFGSACAQVVYGASWQQDWGLASTGNVFPVTAGQTYVYSAWVKSNGTKNISLYLQELTSGLASNGAIKGGSAGAVTTSVSWTRVYVVFTAAASSVWVRLSVGPQNSGQASTTYWVDGIQLESGSYLTPYIETASTLVAKGAGRIQIPVTTLDETQGWLAFRVRLGFSQAAPPGTDMVLFDWRDSSTSRLTLKYTNASSGVYHFDRQSSTGASVQQLLAAVSGNTVTVICTWDATHVKVSANGAAFTSTSNSLIPTLSATLADLGSAAVAGAGFEWMGDILWFAQGSAYLADAQATLIHAQGDTDPNVSLFTGLGLGLLWYANNSSVLNPQPVSLDAGLTTTGALAKVGNFTKTVGLTLTPAQLKKTTKSFAGSLTLTTDSHKKYARALASTLSFSYVGPGYGLSPYGLTGYGSDTVSPMMTFVPNHFRAQAASLAFTNSFSKIHKYNRPLAATLTLTNILALRSSRYRPLNTTLVLTPASARSYVRTPNATLLLTAAIQGAHFNYRSMPVSLVLAPTMNERQKRTLAVTMSLADSLVVFFLGKNQVMNPILNMGVNLKKQMFNALSTDLSLVPSLNRKRYQIESANLLLAMDQHWSFPRTLSANLSLGLNQALLYHGYRAFDGSLALSVAYEHEFIMFLPVDLALLPTIDRFAQTRHLNIGLTLAPEMLRDPVQRTRDFDTLLNLIVSYNWFSSNDEVTGLAVGPGRLIGTRLY